MKSKLPLSGTSIFAKMTALANEYNAINLAQGFPNFNPPQELLDYLYEGVMAGYNQYAPMPGLGILREQIKKRISKVYNYSVDVETEITVYAGATQAIYTAISALISKDDKVIIFEPAYDSYGPAVLVNGGIPVYIRLKLPSFDLPWDELEKILNTENIRLIIFNNPHNPTGRVFTTEDLQKIQTLVKRTNTILLFDEVYDLLVFDDNIHHSALQYPLLMKNSIVVFSMGKTLHNTGWKIGYSIACPEITKELRKVHQFTVFSVNTPAQYAIGKFMENHPDFFNTLPGFYQHKRDLFMNQMKNSSFNILPCEGSYFVLAGYEKISSESDESMADKIVREVGVASIPISAFYHDSYDPHMIRFCFAKNDDTLLQASKQLEEYQ